ncbi:MAG TPA: hypothetical protein VFB72_18110 [Verrucomicrobiae bacterium]|nr:hypothetical protein [Verrucomicrobiae bacterium]
MSVTELVIEKVKALPKDQARDLLSFLEKLEREEEAFDISAARKALEEGQAKGFIPWEKVKANLGTPKRSRKAKS